MKKIGKYLQKIKNILFMTSYFKHYYYSKINDNEILLESKNGKDLAGNILGILLELVNEDYNNYKIYLSVSKDKRESIEKVLIKAGIKLSRIHIISTDTRIYYKHLAVSKYLFTDTSFPRSYVKKEGQIIVNTWHGTPLKKMGRDVGNRVYAMGNVQRNLLYADYLIYPNDYMKEKMVHAYGLEGIYQGTILCEGYPRNSVFFNVENGHEIRKELNLENMQVIMYMPTWRGTLTEKNTEHLLAITEYYFYQLDNKLNDNQVFYVKMHPFVDGIIDFSKYKHIKKYPSQYDTYLFLNMCDCLVTDYSSVFYDYANSHKKIILFAYDETEYLSERGIYGELSDLPFPIVKKVDDLVNEINSDKNYDDTEFIKRYCTYDAPYAAKRICSHVIKGEKVCKEEKILGKQKNVMIYGSALAQNGLTTSLINLLEGIDLGERNYIITFRQSALKKNFQRIEKINKHAGIVPMASENDMSILEAAAYVLYFKMNKQSGFIKKYLDRMYKRELVKHFGGIHIDYMIQFAGYEKNIINLFQRFEGKRIIYVHNDMVQEIKTRNNQHYLTLKNAYREYDKVAVVTEDLIPSTYSISGRKDNICIVNNCNDYLGIRRKAEMELEFEKATKCNVSYDKVIELLNSNKKKIISIGRFSPEKNHKMLMKAYEKFADRYKESCLFIIGGHGVLAKETMDYANESKTDIVIIKSLSNPMPLLKKCDLFILPSSYEGLGLTLLEADTLGIPTVATDIVGPRGFVKQYGGNLIKVSEKAMTKAMNDFMEGKIKAMNVDYEEYNKNALRQFEALF